MPWRAVGARRAGSLPIAETSADPEWLLLRFPGGDASREAAVVPILRRQGGLLIGVSAGFVTPEELEAGAVEGVTQSLGPTLLVGNAESMYRTLNYDQLVIAARERVLTGEGPKSEAYRTAGEGPPPPTVGPSDDLLGQILAQTQATAVLVTRLQDDLEAVSWSEQLPKPKRWRERRSAQAKAAKASRSPRAATSCPWTSC